MENATRAFIMAAGILLGVLILSLGIYLFSIFGQYSANAYETMEKNQITQFNSQFFKYYGNTTYSYVDENGKEKTITNPIQCTAHDIISIVNLAQQNNIQFQLTNEEQASEKTRYIQVDIGKNKKNQNVEKWSETDKINFLRENADKNYKCSAVLTNSVTSRVNHIKFEEIVIP